MLTFRNYNGMETQESFSVNLWPWAFILSSSNDQTFKIKLSGKDRCKKKAPPEIILNLPITGYTSYLTFDVTSIGIIIIVLAIIICAGNPFDTWGFPDLWVSLKTPTWMGKVVTQGESTMSTSSIIEQTKKGYLQRWRKLLAHILARIALIVHELPEI